MNRICTMLVAPILLIAPLRALADDGFSYLKAPYENDNYNGNNLVADCKDFETATTGPTGAIHNFAGGICHGFVIGATNAEHALRLLNRLPQRICYPETVTANQIVRVVLKYLVGHPEKLHVAGVSLVLQAMKEAFPCETKDTKE